MRLLWIHSDKGAGRVGGRRHTLFALEVNRELAKLFDNGFGTVDWEKRKSLMRQPLCLWLQLYFAKFTKPVAVAELHHLSGSTAPLKKFRQNLRVALDVLRKKGVANAWIDRETDSVRYAPLGSAIPETRAATPSKPSSSQSELPLLSPSAPTVSPQAKAKFRDVYPNRDVERCLSRLRSVAQGQRT